MNELFLKAKRAIRFLFYKDISIVDQIRISKILDNEQLEQLFWKMSKACLLYTSPSPRDVEESRMPSSA